MEEQFEKIEQYLSGTLEAAEKQAFEAALAADPALAQEVAVHQMAQQFLGDPAEIDFRRNLESISATFEADVEDTKDNSQPTVSNNLLKWVFIILGAIIIATIIYFIIQNTSTTTETPIPPQEDTINVEELNNNLSLEEDNDTIPSTPIVEEEETTSNTTPPIASFDPFQLNPSLEALTEASQRSKIYDFEMQVNLLPNEGQTNVIIEGELLTAVLPDSGSFQISIYNSDLQNYPASPFLESALNPRLVEGDQPIAFGGKKKYSVLYDSLVDLPAGQYYFVIRLATEATPLYTGKFLKAAE